MKAVLIFVGAIAFIAMIAKYEQCSNSGGTMVQGMIGYQCIKNN